MEIYVLFYEEISTDNGCVDRFAGVFDSEEKAREVAINMGYIYYSIEETYLNKIY